jgi:NAD(P)-dependent dehydrogenase (short-subunit alcohol dehydrogenase family)
LGGLDILVNNAGFENVRPSFDVDEAHTCTNMYRQLDVKVGRVPFRRVE